MIPRRFFWLFDLIILSIAFLTAYWLLPSTQNLFAPGGSLYIPWILEIVSHATWTGPLPPLTDFLWILVAAVPVAILTLAFLGGHTPLLYQSRTRILASSLVAPMAGLGTVSIVLYALKSPGSSRLLSFSFVMFAFVGLCGCRLLLRRYFSFRRAAGYYAKNAVVIGLPAAIEWMTSYFAKHVPTTDYRLLGYLRVCPDQPALPVQPSDQNSVQVTLLGNVTELGNLLVHHPIHEVIAVLPLSGDGWISQVIQDCDYMGMLLRIVPEALLLGERRALKTLYLSEPLHLPAVVLAPPHWDSEALFFKRLFDMLFSAAALIAFSPLLLIVALAIKITTPNLPVLYRWHVVGRNGVEFTGYKFTTMYADADNRKTELSSRNEMTGPVFKIKNDPRATPLGRILRKSSINELPQLWSVLKGDMSLVGPRPAFRHELERYEFWHKRKLSIRPGMTCLWQIRGRNKISNFDDWVRMDLEYIDNWSLWLDMKILWRTVWVVIAGTGS